MLNPNVVAGLAGASIILLSGLGLTEIHSRAGPFEEALVPALIPLEVTGSYVARGPTGTTGPGGVCVPPTGETQCSGARAIVDVAIQGLPLVADGARYQGFLVGPAETWSLGVLTPGGGQHRIRVDEQRDAREFLELRITLELGAAETPGTLEVVSLNVAQQGQQTPHDLAQSSSATVGTGMGTLRAAEIGAFSKSTTAVGALQGVSLPEGWEYHAWFVSSDGGSYLDLGPWEQSGADLMRAELDGRIEKVRLEDQGAFLTTIEPMGSGQGRSAPNGLPAFRVDFPE